MNKRQSRWSQVGDLLIGSVMLQGSSVLLFVFLARWLSVADFAIYRQIFIIHQVLIGVFFSAIPLSLLYFSGKIESNSINIVVHKHLIIVLNFSIVVTLIYLFGGNLFGIVFSSEKLRDSVWMFAPYSVSYMFCGLVAPVLLLYGRSRLSKWFSAFLGVVNSVPVLYVAGSGASLHEVIATASTSSVLGGVFAVLIITWLCKIGINNRSAISYAEIFKYLTPLLIAGGVGLIGLRMDQLMVSKLLGAGYYGIYVVGAFEIPIFGMLQSSVSTVLLPTFSKLAQLKDWRGIGYLWRLALIKSAIVVYPIAAMLFVLADVFVNVVFGDKFKDAAVIFRLYLLLAPVRIMTFGLVLRACGDNRYDLLGSVAYCFFVAGGAFLGVKYFGMAGAMGAVLLTTVALGVWLIWRTTIITSGAITYSTIYPVKVMLAFPLLVGFYWISMSHVIELYKNSSGLIVLIFGGLIAGVTIVVGNIIRVKLFSGDIENEKV